MSFVIGLTITFGSVLGGCVATGGCLAVLDQPFEFLIICGASIGIVVVANLLLTIKDAGKAIFEAITGQTPKQRDYLDQLNALHALMRELRAHTRTEVEAHFDNPHTSPVFSGFPRLLANEDMLPFVCDYCGLWAASSLELPLRLTDRRSSRRVQVDRLRLLSPRGIVLNAS